MGWPLEMRFTVSWDACLHGARNYGHVLGLSDKGRNERLRSELRRVLREAGHPFVCIWARDEGGHHGLHSHLGLYWPLPLETLISVLARLTGSPVEPVTTRRGVLAESECGGWQVKHNTALEAIPSAMRWTAYLLNQGEGRLIVPAIEGKAVSVSRAIDACAMAPHREALEGWKRRRGWIYAADA